MTRVGGVVVALVHRELGEVRLALHERGVGVPRVPAVVARVHGRGAADEVRVDVPRAVGGAHRGVEAQRAQVGVDGRGRVGEADAAVGLDLGVTLREAGRHDRRLRDRETLKGPVGSRQRDDERAPAGGDRELARRAGEHGPQAGRVQVDRAEPVGLDADLLPAHLAGPGAPGPEVLRPGEILDLTQLLQRLSRIRFFVGTVAADTLTARTSASARPAVTNAPLRRARRPSSREPFISLPSLRATLSWRPWIAGSATLYRFRDRDQAGADGTRRTSASALALRGS